MDSSIEKLIRSDQLIIDCKKQAKFLKTSLGKSLMECQNIVAKQKGYYDWHTLHTKIKDKYITDFNPVEDLIINSFINGEHGILISFRDKCEPEVQIRNEYGSSKYYTPIDNLLDYFKLFLTKHNKEIKEFKTDLIVDTIIFNNARKPVGSVIYQAIPVYPNGFDLYIKFNLFKKHILSLEDLGFSTEQTQVLMKFKKGVIIFAGTSGSGRSTSIACLINQIAGIREVKAIKFSDYNSENLYLNKYPVHDTKNNYSHALTQIINENYNILKFPTLGTKDQAQSADIAGKNGLSLSSVNASGATSVIDRLEDFKIKDINKSNLCVSVYQTLLPTLCPYCRIKKDNTWELIQGNFPYLENSMHKANIYFKGNGCKHCNNGLNGRTVCAEIVEIDEKAKKMITTKGYREFAIHWHISKDNDFFSSKIQGNSAHHHAIKKMLEGQISPEDVNNKFGMRDYSMRKA